MGAVKKVSGGPGGPRIQRREKALCMDCIAEGGLSRQPVAKGHMGKGRDRWGLESKEEATGEAG